MDPCSVMTNSQPRFGAEEMHSEEFFVIQGLSATDCQGMPLISSCRLAVNCIAPYVAIIHWHMSCTLGFPEKPNLNLLICEQWGLLLWVQWLLASGLIPLVSDLATPCDFTLQNLLSTQCIGSCLHSHWIKAHISRYRENPLCAVGKQRRGSALN